MKQAQPRHPSDFPLCEGDADQIDKAESRYATTAEGYAKERQEIIPGHLDIRLKG